MSLLVAQETSTTNLILGEQPPSSGNRYDFAQGFQLAKRASISGAELSMAKLDGATTDITVRIETDNAGAPSGTLAHANATATISGLTDTSQGWRAVSFTPFDLDKNTTYWLVADMPNSGAYRYNWYASGTNPYAGGNATERISQGAWSARSGDDMMFRINGEFYPDAGGAFLFNLI